VVDDHKDKVLVALPYGEDASAACLDDEVHLELMEVALLYNDKEKHVAVEDCHHT